MISKGLLALLIGYLPGEISFGLLLLGTAVLAILPLFFAPASGLPTWSWTAVWPYLLIFLIAILFRLPNLDYAEFQGDEGVIMVRAAAMIMGDDAELFLHQKGPIEILQPLPLWQLSGSINEAWARALFTWASLLPVLAVMVLGWQWFGRAVDVWAGVLFSLVGFSIAFGRIVQYQSFVVLWGAMALYHAVCYARHSWRGDLLLTAVFLAGGLLAHYDAILVAPAIGWVLLKPIFKQKQLVWRDYLLSPVDPNSTLATNDFGAKVSLQGHYNAFDNMGVFGYSEYLTGFETWFVEAKPYYELDNGIKIGTEFSISGGPDYLHTRTGIFLSGYELNVPWVGLFWVGASAGALIDADTAEISPYAGLNLARRISGF